jgi:hypothetical protein
MQKQIEVHSQAEFDVCVKAGNIAVVIGCYVEAWDNSSVEAWGNSSVTPVALRDIVVHPEGQYPEKIKAKGCCGPVWQVACNGKKIEGA